MRFVDSILDKRLRTKLGGYTWPAETRKQADRIVAFATDDAVQQVAMALEDVTADEVYPNNGSLWMAVCLLAQHAGTDPGSASGQALLALAERLRDDPPLSSTGANYRYALWDTLSFYPEVPDAVAAKDVLGVVFASQPPHPLLTWADSIGLKAPTDRSWSLRLPVAAEEDASPSFDVDAQVRWAPDDNAKVGLIASESWWAARPSHDFITAGPAFSLVLPGQGLTLSGTVPVAPGGMADLPQLLTALEELTGVRFDRAKPRMQLEKGMSRKALLTWLRS